MNDNGFRTFKMCILLRLLRSSCKKKIVLIDNTIKLNRSKTGERKKIYKMAWIVKDFSIFDLNCNHLSNRK